MKEETLNIKNYKFLSPGKSINRKIRLLLFTSIALWCTGFLLPVFNLHSSVGLIFTNYLKYIYSLVCNQSPNATFAVHNHSLLVCARCSGLYSGALIAAVLFLLTKTRFNLTLKPLILFSLPLIIDAISVRIGIYDYSKSIAFVTGLLCGSIIFVYILDVLENSLNTLQKEYEFK